MTDKELQQADGVIDFLSRCGNDDIEEGVSQILGLGSSKDISKFREGIQTAINKASLTQDELTSQRGPPSLAAELLRRKTWTKFLDTK